MYQSINIRLGGFIAAAMAPPRQRPMSHPGLGQPSRLGRQDKMQMDRRMHRLGPRFGRPRRRTRVPWMRVPRAAARAEGLRAAPCLFSCLQVFERCAGSVAWKTKWLSNSSRLLCPELLGSVQTIVLVDQWPIPWTAMLGEQAHKWYPLMERCLMIYHSGHALRQPRKRRNYAKTVPS